MEKLPCATDKQVSLTDVINLFDTGLSNLTPYIEINGVIKKPDTLNELVANKHYYSKEDILLALANFL